MQLYSFVSMRMTYNNHMIFCFFNGSKLESSALTTCIVLLILTAGHRTSLMIKSSFKDDIGEDFGGDHDNQHQGSLLNTGPDVCHIFLTTGKSKLI